ncbi:YveK family protein [Paenibacillus sp. Leaf72]|uniref:YveK family protein n=1 Tax=Paenibacillus sp. Leaf72 TaxID=1736234 RepID=UPI0006F5594D|nr:Wzz/FepE/Etk N-terminal domain-containing protein [Paenibacillus sp. Leaf72]KQN99034.1 lipopolysaccharide biosynthesis protein [Paenibacillus sp. Leaf72]
MELKQYMKMIRKKIGLVAVIVLIACVAAAVKSFFFTTPIYQAHARLLVNQTALPDGQFSPSVGTLQTNIMMINSYKVIIKSETILGQVTERYPELNITPAQLAGRISVSSAENSQVMDLLIRDQSYARAAQMVNAVSTVFKEQIPLIMKVDNVTVLDKANEKAAAYPINNNPIFVILVSFVAALMLAIGLVFLIEYLDDTFKMESEVEAVLGIPVIASVPKMTKEDVRPSRKRVLNNQGVGEGQHATINQ